MGIDGLLVNSSSSWLLDQVLMIFQCNLIVVLPAGGKPFESSKNYDGHYRAMARP
jgi:hypothetical protein